MVTPLSPDGGSGQGLGVASGPGSHASHGAASVSAVPVSIPNAAHVRYLEEHHHIAESMIGILRLHATTGALRAVQSYSDQLDLLQINRLLDQGVPAHEIGESGTFYAPDHLVASAIEARSGETVGLDPKGESAVPKADAKATEVHHDR